MRWESTRLGDWVFAAPIAECISTGDLPGGWSGSGSTTLPLLGVELRVDPDERDATRYRAENDQRGPGAGRR